MVTLLARCAVVVHDAARIFTTSMGTPIARSDAMTRFVRSALVVLFAIGTLGACEGGKGDGDIEQGITPAPRGGGFCCPIDPGTCNCFRNGGWISNEADTCPAICDLAPVNTRITSDEHGCESLSGPESCLQPPLDASLD
jgi:hypothetical protein